MKHSIGCEWIGNRDVPPSIEQIKRTAQRIVSQMPHYADGAPAQIGDMVFGKPYNTPREVVGTLVSITPGTESCNCQVAFVEVSEAETLFKGPFGGDCQFTGINTADGRRLAARVKTDYGETRAFTKISVTPTMANAAESESSAMPSTI